MTCFCCYVATYGLCALLYLYLFVYLIVPFYVKTKLIKIFLSSHSHTQWLFLLFFCLH